MDISFTVYNFVYLYGYGSVPADKASVMVRESPISGNSARPKSDQSASA